jgi:hypothetical protein
LITAPAVDVLTRAHAATDTHDTDLLHSGWYETEEVAALLGVDASTLRRWRTASPPQGPPFVQFTSRITKYSVPDVQAWLAAMRVDPAEAA